MTDFNPQQLLGSLTAKGGFQNEHDVVAKFNDYATDTDAQTWLTLMGYDLNAIEALTAIQIPTRLNNANANRLGIEVEALPLTQKFKKADIQVQIWRAGQLYRENISLKKANLTANFNQIDKRSVDTYQSMWVFDAAIATTLKQFTGVIVPSAQQAPLLKDRRRWYLNELPAEPVARLLQFLTTHQTSIVNDILKGRGNLAADWFLVTQQQPDGRSHWLLKDIQSVVNFFAQGPIGLSQQGGLVLGRLTAQRKGGTPDPTSLQFKIKPLDLFLHET